MTTTVEGSHGALFTKGLGTNFRKKLRVSPAVENLSMSVQFTNKLRKQLMMNLCRTSED